MKQTTSIRAWVLMLLCGLAMAAGFATQVAAQKAEEKKQRTTRLPAHYAKVVTEEQRSDIYAIQEQFEPKLAKARAELKALVDERDAAIEKVLSAQQRKDVAKLRAEAEERRREALSKLEPEELPAESESKEKTKGKKAA
jgi:spermidine/putrescine-binding protein